MTDPAPGVALGQQIGELLLRAQSIESRARQIAAESEELVVDVAKLAEQFVIFAADAKTTAERKRARARTAADVMRETIETAQAGPPKRKPVKKRASKGSGAATPKPEPELIGETAPQSPSKPIGEKPAPVTPQSSTTAVSVELAPDPDESKAPDDQHFPVSDQKFPCPVCEVTFLSKARLDRHELKGMC